MLTAIAVTQELSVVRVNDLSEPTGLYIEMAAALEATNWPDCISRAAFIREQCNGCDGKMLFDTCREDWEI